MVISSIGFVYGVSDFWPWPLVWVPRAVFCRSIAEDKGITALLGFLADVVRTRWASGSSGFQ